MTTFLVTLRQEDLPDRKHPYRSGQQSIPSGWALLSMDVRGDGWVHTTLSIDTQLSLFDIAEVSTQGDYLEDFGRVISIAEVIPS